MVICYSFTSRPQVGIKCDLVLFLLVSDVLKPLVLYIIKSLFRDYVFVRLRKANPRWMLLGGPEEMLMQC